MDVTVKSIGALERSMRVELPIEPIEQQVDSRLKSVGRTAKIKGFRPGKVPAKVVKQRFGKQVRKEVLSDVLQKSFSAAVTQEKLRPAGGPKIETEAENGKTFAFTATFEVMPEFELKNLEKIEIDKPEVTIGDDDIDAMLASLQKQKATWEVVDRKSGEGDRVVIDFVGKLKGEVFPGGEGKDYQIVIGAGQMLADFEKGLEGMQAGDEKTFKVKFPKDYHAEELAGKKADFTITAHRVEAEILPELNDDFAAMFNVAEGGLKRFKADVRENMEREADLKVRTDVREQVMKALLEANPLAIPQTLKHQEMHALQREAMQRLGLKDAEHAPPLGDFSAAAEQRVALGLLLRQVISDKELTTDAAMLRARVEELCAGYENSDEMVNMYLSNPQVMEQIEPMVIEQQAVDWILDNGKVKPKKISFGEFMNPPAS
ncbi:MAG: trigger factor [Proteobacteria bacterium]|nr:trigger factor [Pseudomonadota bacterium]